MDGAGVLVSWNHLIKFGPRLHRSSNGIVYDVITNDGRPTGKVVKILAPDAEVGYTHLCEVSVFRLCSGTPGVVPLEWIWMQPDGGICMVMPKATCSLQHCIEKYYQNTYDALKVVRDIVEAVRNVWRTHRVLHLDLKPANVLIMPDGNALIADFGLSRFVRRSAAATVSGSGASSSSVGIAADDGVERGSDMVQTVYWRAPECFSGDRIGHATDMWSIGVIAAELCLGENPFSADSDKACFRRIDEFLRGRCEQYQRLRTMCDKRHPLAMLSLQLLRRDSDSRPSAHAVLDSVAFAPVLGSRLNDAPLVRGEYGTTRKRKASADNTKHGNRLVVTLSQRSTGPAAHLSGGGGESLYFAAGLKPDSQPKRRAVVTPPGWKPYEPSSTVDSCAAVMFRALIESKLVTKEMALRALHVLLACDRVSHLDKIDECKRMIQACVYIAYKICTATHGGRYNTPVEFFNTADKTASMIGSIEGSVVLRYEQEAIRRCGPDLYRPLEEIEETIPERLIQKMFS